jgi:hypothetical protein
MPVSMLREDFSSGGFLDDVIVTVTGASYTYFDYDGKGKRTCAAKLDLQLEDGTAVDQHFSCGDPKFFAPSADGDTLEPLGEKGTLNDKSNWALFLASLQDFPEYQTEEATGVLRGGQITPMMVGLKFHLSRKPAPKRAGMAPRPGANGEPAREQTIVIATAVYATPWAPEKTESKKRGKRAPTKTASAKQATLESAAEANGDLDQDLTTMIVDILRDSADGVVEKVDLGRLVFVAAAADARKKALVQRSVQAAFLDTGNGEHWVLDGTKVQAL